MNDLPMDQVPPNVVHLQRTQFGERLAAEEFEVSVPKFDCRLSRFTKTIHYDMPVSCRHSTFGLTIATDSDSNRAFISRIHRNSSASKLHSTLKATNNKLRGAYIVKINDKPVFTQAEVDQALRQAFESKLPSVSLEIAPEQRLPARDLHRARAELQLHSLDLQDADHVHRITIDDIRSIAAIQHADDHMSFTSADVSFESVSLAINAIASAATTSAEAAIGTFTRRKLRKLETWPEWKAGEKKQLDQFHDLGMYGEPIPRPPGAIVLRPHWQYRVKRDGTRRARNCCDGSKKAAPALHRLAKTYSSCVEQPIQRLFFALCAKMGYQVFGGDAKDAYAHSPAPEVPTYVHASSQPCTRTALS